MKLSRYRKLLLGTRTPLRELVEFGVVCFLACVLANLLSGCTFEPVVRPDPYPVSDHLKGCEKACYRLEAMLCPGWEGSPGRDGLFGTEDDVSCVNVCVYTINQGFPFEYKCIADAKSCIGVMECGD